MTTRAADRLVSTPHVPTPVRAPVCRPGQIEARMTLTDRTGTPPQAGTWVRMPHARRPHPAETDRRGPAHALQSP